MRPRSRSQRLPSPNCVLIAGAGWSAAAGLPLAGQLFDVAGGSMDLSDSDRAVIATYEQWRSKHRESPSEQFIAYAYGGHAEHVVRSLPGSSILSAHGQLRLDLEGGRILNRYGASWPEVAAYLQRRLATPTVPTHPARTSRRAGDLRYRPALLRRTACPAQAAFWNHLLEDSIVRAVVTTNYDLTIEQTAGLRPNDIPGSPGFHYAGIDNTVHPVSSPFGRDRRADPSPRGAIPLAKLHGSLNWRMAPQGIEVFADLRPAFGYGGQAAIVPPLPEKEVPYWLRPVWDRAAEELRAADEWVVVGYSLPPYDHEITALLTRCGRNVRRIRIYDPCSQDVANRWSSLARRARVETHPGLQPVSADRTGENLRLPSDEIARRRSRTFYDPRVGQLLGVAGEARTGEQAAA